MSIARGTQRLAIRQHRKLLRLLGGKCAWCGETRIELLQVDHPNGRRMPNHHPDHRKKSLEAKVRELWMEYASDVPQQDLCKKCNSKDGRRRQLERSGILRTHWVHVCHVGGPHRLALRRGVKQCGYCGAMENPP